MTRTAYFSAVLEEWYYYLLPVVLNMTLAGSMVILAVCLGRYLLRRAPKIFSYVLWLPVLFRLLCPLTVTWDLSLFRFLGIPTDDTLGALEFLPTTIVHTEYPSVYVPLPGVSEAITGLMPHGHMQVAADPMEGDMSFLTLVWLGGIAVLLLSGLVRYGVWYLRLVGKVRYRDNIWLADHVASPFVIGLIRPKIILPSRLPDTMPEQELDWILRHERHHIRRGDPLWRLIGYLTLCIHWFNPLVWLAYALSARDMEMSCDEAVMRSLDEDVRRAYAASLLYFATGRRLRFHGPLAFGESDTKKRVRNVMDFRQPVKAVLAVCGIVVLCLAAVLVTNPTEKNTTIVGAEYQVDRIMFDRDGSKTADSAPSYTITADFQLYENGDGSWKKLGLLEPYSLSSMTNHYLGYYQTELTAKELYLYTDDARGRTLDHIPPVTDARILRLEGDRFYLVFQAGGRTYLGYGWEDMENRGHPTNDTTRLDWVVRLESLFRQGSIHTGFFLRSLRDAAGVPVNTFLYYEGSRMIVCFYAGTDMQDLGWAMFRSQEGEGYTLEECHIYEGAASVGAFQIPDPIVMTDSTGTHTYDGILITNEEVRTVVWELADGTSLERGISGADELVLMDRTETAAGVTAVQYHDRYGNPLVP